ncbi:hypothetical protein [Vibrio europaeus]|uniref:hypothetical protein n=1 Tax=Vibrio europaeus TaxID=300876 RepID=UPI00345B2C59
MMKLLSQTDPSSTLVKNKVNGVSGKKKLLERAIVLGAIIAAVAAVMMASSLYQLYLENLS